MNSKQKVRCRQTKMSFNAVLIVLLTGAHALQLMNKNLTLELTLTDGSVEFVLFLGNTERISGTIGESQNLSLLNCTISDCTANSLNIKPIDSGFEISWKSNRSNTTFRDCISVEGNVSWFGGSERYHAKWPIEELVIPLEPYRVSKLENGAIAERYWLNSRGSYVYVDEEVPLFLDQNNFRKNTICLIAKVDGPYVGRKEVLLKYFLVAKSDPKQAQIHAVLNHLGRPSGHPNERIIRYPIWTTWAKYKRNISDDSVLEFGREIAGHGFTGQLEIDDFWESCYGSLTFNDKFSNINSTVKTLQDLGFTVSVWVHPFVNDDCEEPTEIGRKNYYFINSINGELISWWNGNASRHIDFTKVEAQDWFKSRLNLLKLKHGLDSFKFDAGETDWAPDPPILQSNLDLTPNFLTNSYVKTCATFGDLIEVRSGWRSQNLPVLVRMIDKDSRWGLDNGLQSLIVTLLQMNIAGYTLVLPDIIGGNGYGKDVLTPELLIRWIQANTFMPVMQFSYLPWEISSHQFDSVAIARKFIALHEKYTEEILKAINASVNEGTPVNPPIWWVDPTNQQALQVNDEFLLGENILVAPVVEQGVTSRNIVLPSGSWKDGNNGTIYKGPKILENYPAPINLLPYFIKQ